MKHPAQAAAESLDREVKTRGHKKPIKNSKATLVYGPYPEKDGTRDSFCITFYDPETGEQGKPMWADGIGTLAHVLEENLKPNS